MITISGSLEDWVIRDVIEARKNETKKTQKKFKARQKEEESILKSKIDQSRPQPKKKINSLFDYIPFGKAILSFFSKSKI